ncbi:unnamed protein product [Adineta ricciae]|uniref:FAD dependent oxidoreductase domain-containing protein n=2 Tax=Adineta ricciae TaxID=249248 RepID=A0A814MBK5_ADIRI|nr:unnamed protein product [Adineta ricciae]
MSSVYDIIIVGGGIVGLGVFRQLTLNGFQSILLLEKSSQILTGASSGNSGILHTGFDAVPHTLESKLVKRGYHLYQSFRQDVELPIKKIGAYLIAWKEDDLQILKEVKDTAHQNDVLDIEEISSTMLYEREPLLRHGALAALHIPGESVVDPLTLPLILLMHGKIFGGHIQTNVEVINGEYDYKNQCWALNDGQYRSRIVVNCAGLYGDIVEQIRIKQQKSSTNTFTIQPRMGQFSVYSPPPGTSPLKSIILPIPTKFTKGVIVYPNLFNQIIVGPTAQTQFDRSQAPIKSDVTRMLHEKINELIPSCANSNYTRIGSYTGIRPATEHSDYQIHAYNEIQWICCGGIRSTGLTSSLAIGEYIYELVNEMSRERKYQLHCAGYSAERYSRSLDQLKVMFIATPQGLQPKLIMKDSTLTVSAGDIEFTDEINITNLKIECNGELFDVSHSLLKLAWMTTNSSFITPHACSD